MEIANQTGPGFDDWFLAQLANGDVKQFTKVQQLAVEAGVCDRASLIVCAPTSSGKTLVGELALLAAIRHGGTVLYLVSHKALADQKFVDLERRYGISAKTPIAKVALATGDRDDGETDANVIVATYEKAISLVMTGALPVVELTIIADELQIIGEDKRGPEIEVLCAALRQRSPKQFVALTATVENGEDLAGWLNCRLVHTSHRDVELHQEIWWQNQTFSVKFGQEEGVTTPKPGLPTNTLDAVDYLRESGRGPILVFVETRNDAMRLAADYSARRGRTPEGYRFSEQLDLFSEATEFSARLRASTETNVAFHTADLTPSERSVIEQGLMDNHFDVCFATPTLAAGVNFPFRSVLFDRVRRQYIPPADMPLGSYRNMSGRAGRLGMHEQGYSIIIPRDALELRLANRLVSPQNEMLHSKLASLSVRKIVLQLIACESAKDAASTKEFLENTLFWYQVQDRNPVKLQELTAKIDEAIEWLINADMIQSVADKLSVTKFGKVVAQTGLLPTSAVLFSELLRQNADALDGRFEDFEVALLAAVCCSDEFDTEIGQRYLPNVARDASSDAAYQLLDGTECLNTLNHKRLERNRAHCVYALFLYISGEIERKIGASSGVPSGQVHRFAVEVAWMLNGLRHIAAVPSLGVSQKVMNQLKILTRRVELGVPMELTDLLAIAQKARVPGFGRQRALALRRAGLCEPSKILDAAFDDIERILANSDRARLLLQAIERSESDPYKRAERKHRKFAQPLGLVQLVDDLYAKLGNDYEDPVEQILRLETGWHVQKIDDGVRQGVPDFMLTFGERSLVLECKTTTKRPPLINKEEAFAVLHKAADIANVHKVSLGKPSFDTFSESKACASVEITLLKHSDFVEAMLLLRSGALTAADVFDWLMEPGVSELERLGQIPL
ncbi:DEAD/DEAH box helicase [Pseudoduganella sp. FT26W]|uniref:DEAD/DEAH box helicase n=1 Tax=Duganella aquatilis TaxID=2666082 RepID=A0A844D838_9BURK|nr:DEAD/DEAH box helicase [Duganella aquatilis]MRW83720.1 DEAD/DEAH box helicase [Duganella aquatilis]